MNPVLKGRARGQAIDGKGRIFSWEKICSVFVVEYECISY